MNDQTFPPFPGFAPPGAVPEDAPKKRGRKPAPPVAEASDAPKKRGPKPKAAVEGAVEAPKKRGPKPGPAGAVKVDMGVMLRALSGNQPEDYKLLTDIAGALSSTSKVSRARILTALNRMFG